MLEENCAIPRSTSIPALERYHDNSLLNRKGTTGRVGARFRSLVTLESLSAVRVILRGF